MTEDPVPARPPALARSSSRSALAAMLVALGSSGCDGCDGAPAAVAAPPPSVASAVPGGKRFLKGQLHAHSNRSGDSDTDPEEVVGFYAAHGYDFLVITDHDWITKTLAPPGLLLVRGVELTQNLRSCEPPPAPGSHCLLHVNALFTTASPGPIQWDPISSLRRDDLYGRGVELARALGGIAQLNHPNFHEGADLDVVLALARRGLTLMEIENRALDSANEGGRGRPSTEALWDAALTRGARVYGTASDDAHHYGDAAAVRARGELAYVGDRGFVMVRAEPTEPSLRAAMASGDFYGSTGLLFDRLEISPIAIVAAVHDDGRGGPITVEVVGPGGVVARAEGPSLRVDPRVSTAAYLRVRARDASGRLAFAQPLFR